MSISSIILVKKSPINKRFLSSSIAKTFVVKGTFILSSKLKESESRIENSSPEPK
jgi:hypothetical protein